MARSNLKSDAQGFIIADTPLTFDDMHKALDGVHSDTTDILRLMKDRARADLVRQQRVGNPAAAGTPARPDAGERRSVSAALAAGAPARSTARTRIDAPVRVYARDERGRFIGSSRPSDSTPAMRTPAPVSARIDPPAARPTGQRGSARAQTAAAAVPPPALSPVTKAIDSLTRQQAAQVTVAMQSKRAQDAARRRGDAATNARRDQNGRFVGKGSSRSAGGAVDEDGKSGIFGRLRNRLQGHSGSFPAPGTGELEKVDPTVEAAKEFGSIVRSPAASIGKLTKSTYSLVSGRSADAKNPALPWYRRIYNVLRSTSEDSAAANVDQGRTLKEIDKKVGGGGASSSGGGLRGLFSGLTKGGGGILKSMGSLLLGGGGGLLKLGKLAMRRLPLIGGLLAGGSALASMFGPDDPDKTGEENRNDRFTGVGSGAGALIGGAVGMLLGPVGAIVGGAIGDKVGELVGKWLSTLDWAAIGKDITEAWGKSVSYVQDTWKSVTDKFSDAEKAVSKAWTDLLNGAKSFLKDKFGIDVDAVVERASNVVKPVVDTAKGVASTAVDKAKEVASPVVDTAKKVAGAVADSAEAFWNYGKGRIGKMAEPIGRAAGQAWDKAEEASGSLLEKVAPGYRHKATFDGVKGGTALQKYGSYTDEEATTIRNLKQTGANTTANVDGGMPRDVQEKIIAQAKANNLDPRMMLQFASIESGGNANAVSSTGAIGIFQETGKTASGLGVKNRFDVDQNIAGGMKLASDNTKMLQRAKLPVNAENLYMMHQLGPQAAKEVISGAAQGKTISSLSQSTQDAIAQNYGKGSKTAAEYLKKNSDALVARADSVIGKSATGYLDPDSIPARGGGPLPTAVAAVAPAAAPAPAAEPTKPAAATQAVATASPAAVDAAAPIAATVAPPPAGTDAALSPAPAAPPQVPPVAVAAAPPAAPRISMPSVRLPAINMPPPVVDASIPVPLNSSGPMSVRVTNDQPVGQDVKDRRLAQIATGGVAV
ncbi:transglycosylase SLT domain-containing protein [Burkholderia gladioli]|uniref:transglycosylase SLT domain-containing protein n=1 Tax=Burkholderia gladioli TaxID=28095 RepID=UPI00163EAFAD|nr:transglycosylase SLT domain-containing protein [Burkholderia gladioli]